MNPNNSTALITGASGGIGYELAKIAASHKMNLILVARSKDKLEEIRKELKSAYGVEVVTFTYDLSIPDNLPKLVEEIDREKLPVDILINNAGFGYLGAFSETHIEKELSMVSLNVYALTYLTKIFYKRMLNSGKGKIMNLSSVAAFFPGPHMAVYYATKAYVESFTESLAAESKGTGVSLTALCPGPTLSDFFATASMNNNSRMKRFLGLPTAEVVAQYGFKKMMKGKTIAIHGFMNQLSIFTMRFTPRKVAASLVKWMHAKDS